MEFCLAGGAARYSETDAFETVREYAFATVPLKAIDRFSNEFEPHRVPAYAYRTYDCIPASPGAQFSDLDVLIGAGPNARLDVRAVVRVRSFVDRSARYLDLAHARQPDFYKLPLRRGRQGPRA